LFLASLSVSAQVNTDRMIMIGRNALYFEDYVVAIQYFNQVISAKPYLAEPYYLRGMAKFMLDDFKGAQEDCALCLERNPYYTAAYQLRGAAYQNQKKYEQAAADYKKSLDFYPEDKLTLVNMGIVNIELKQYDDAAKTFAALLNRFPDYSPGYLTRAQMHLEQNDTVQAMADYDKAIEIDPYTGQSFSARGLLYYQLKDYNKSLADLDEAIRLDPYQQGNYINRGLIKYNLNDLRGAMADYDRVIEMDGNNLIARFNRGLLRAHVADNNRAIKDFDKVLELEPDNTIAYLNRAMLNSEIGDKSAALSDLNVVLAEYPDFYTGYYMRSQLKRELNDLRGAEADYNLARSEETKARKAAVAGNAQAGGKDADKKTKDTREQTDRDIDKFNLLVVEDKESEEKNKYASQSRGKVQNYAAEIAFEPLFTVSYYEKDAEIRRPVYFSKTLDATNGHLGLKWKLRVTNHEASLDEFQVQNHFRSIDNYSKEIADNPSVAALYFGRGMDFMLVQDYENALSDVNRAVSLDSTFVMAYFVRAIIRTKQLEVTPQNGLGNPRQSLSPLANSFTSNGASAKLPEISTRSLDYDAILKDYETVLKLDPDFIFARYNRAEIFGLEKDYRAAITDYTEAIKREPQFAEAYFNRGLSRLSIGDAAAGLEDLRKAGELGIVSSYSIIKRMQ
jgi:tetratricopeptide (TPR) repeat protein